MLMKDKVYRVNKNCLVHTNRIGKYQFTGEGDVAVLIDDNGEYFSIKPVHLEPYVKPIKILVMQAA